MNPPVHPSSPPASAPNPSIAVEINTATRKLHTELNRLIIARLPLALPTQAQTPARYAAGLKRFAKIYFAFESAFAKIALQASNVEAAQGASNGHDAHREAVHKWLAALVPSNLQRSERLRTDLSHLKEKTGIVSARDMRADEDEWTIRIKSHETQPHILVAYAWIMYMAIFSGGRWIRLQLSSAGSEFWIGGDGHTLRDVDDKKQQQDLRGFSFLSFDGDEDGEELKAAFKAHLADADKILTPTERTEIVDAAQDLFTQCIDLIGQIDEDVRRRETPSLWPIAAVILGLALGWLIWTRRSMFTFS